MNEKETLLYIQDRLNAAHDQVAHAKGTAKLIEAAWQDIVKSAELAEAAWQQIKDNHLKTITMGIVKDVQEDSNHVT